MLVLACVVPPLLLAPRGVVSRTRPSACRAVGLSAEEPAVEQWEELLQCLHAFRLDTNRSVLPAAFVVPDRAPYPEGSWGDRLGRRFGRVAQAARRGTLDSSREQAIAQLGLDLRAANERGFDTLVLALEAFHAQHGHANVAASFVVPHGEAAWPQACWGLRLGNRVNAVRSKRRYVEGRPDRAQKLDELGFVWTAHSERFETLIVALDAFRAQEGHLRVPQLFRVPAAEPWPARCWGIPLGMRVHAIRNQGQYVSHATLGDERRRQLDSLGFEWQSEGRRRS